LFCNNIQTVSQSETCNISLIEANKTHSSIHTHIFKFIYELCIRPKNSLWDLEWSSVQQNCQA
jgi:hypothetical protein